MALELGGIVDGRYRIDSVVGSGGFGTVYRAFHLVLKRNVAIKVLRPDRLLDNSRRQELLARFSKEGQALTKLRHQNIVAALDMGHVQSPDGGLDPYLVIEWCDGGSLRDFLSTHSKIPVETACVLFDSILDAMAHAHRQGVIHCDLKTANIMLSVAENGWSPRVVDFGIARFFSAESSDNIGGTESAAGVRPFTPAYAAPEQWVGAKTGPFTDVHALGLLFVELVSGEKPFDGDDYLAAVTDPVRPTPKSKGVDVGDYEPVIAKAIALRPQDRWADAGQMLSAWRAVSQNSSVDNGPLGRPILGLFGRDGGLNTNPNSGSNDSSLRDRSESSSGSLQGAFQRGEAVSTERPKKRVAIVSVISVLCATLIGLVGLGIKKHTSQGAPASSKPIASQVTAAEPRTPLCERTPTQLSLDLEKAGIPTIGVFASPATAYSPAYMAAAFQPDSEAKTLRIFQNSPISVQTTVEGEFYYLFSTSSTDSMVIGAKTGCHVLLTGKTSTRLQQVVRELFAPEVPETLAKYPSETPNKFSETFVWQLGDLLRAAGYQTSGDTVLPDRASVGLLQESKVAVHMATTLEPWQQLAENHSGAYAVEGTRVIWVTGSDTAQATELLNKVVGRFHIPILPGKNVPQRTPPIGDEWRRANTREKQQLNGHICTAKELQNWWLVSCAHNKKEQVTASIVAGNFEAIIDSKDEAGFVAHEENNPLKLMFSTPGHAVVFDLTLKKFVKATSLD